MKVDDEKINAIMCRANYSNGFEIRFARQSFDFRRYSDTLNHMIANGQLKFVKRVRNTVYYTPTTCYGNEFHLRKHCLVQCDSCKVIQLQKQKLQSSVENRREMALINKVKNPSKFQQIVKILFK